MKDVLVYRLMTCGTIEEKIYRKQVFKGGLFKVATEHKEQFRYFSQQDLRELLTLPRSGFDISLTQQQLEEEHSSQYKIDTNLKGHIQFLKSQGIAGVSHHDLLFSKQDPTRPLEVPCASRRANDQGSISTSKQSSSNIEKLHHAKQPTDSVKDIKARTQQSDVQAIIMEDIRRLSKTLADQATISKLPDQGVKIKGRIRVLTDLLQEMNKTNSKTLSSHCDSNDSKIYNGHKVPSKGILSGVERTIIDVEGKTPSSNHDNSNAKICNDQRVSSEKALLRGAERTSIQTEWKMPPSYSNNSSTNISNQPRVPSEKENSVSNIDDVLSGFDQLDIV